MNYLGQLVLVFCSLCFFVACQKEERVVSASDSDPLYKTIKVDSVVQAYDFDEITKSVSITPIDFPEGFLPYYDDFLVTSQHFVFLCNGRKEGNGLYIFNKDGTLEKTILNKKNNLGINQINNVFSFEEDFVLHDNKNHKLFYLNDDLEVLYTQYVQSYAGLKLERLGDNYFGYSGFLAKGVDFARNYFANDIIDINNHKLQVLDSSFKVTSQYFYYSDRLKSSYLQTTLSPFQKIEDLLLVHSMYDNWVYDLDENGILSKRYSIEYKNPFPKQFDEWIAEQDTSLYAMKNFDNSKFQQMSKKRDSLLSGYDFLLDHFFETKDYLYFNSYLTGKGRVATLHKKDSLQNITTNKWKNSKGLYLPTQFAAVDYNSNSLYAIVSKANLRYFTDDTSDLKERDVYLVTLELQ